MGKQVVTGMLGVFLVAIALIGTAQADTLDLSGISNVRLSYNPERNIDVSYDYRGFHFYGNGDVNNLGYEWISGWAGVAPSSLCYIGIHSATPFAFNGVSITSQSAENPAWLLSIEGWSSGSKVYSMAIGLTLSPKYFNVNFENIDEIRFNSYMEVFHVSDFTYSRNDPPTPVPESSIFLVLAGGLISIICWRKRIAA